MQFVTDLDLPKYSRRASVSGVTDLLLGVRGVVRVYEGCRVVEHGALTLLCSKCVRVYAYAPRFHMVCAGNDIGDGKLIRSEV